MIRLLLTLSLIGTLASSVRADDGSTGDDSPRDEAPAIAEIPGSRLVDLTTSDGLREGYADVMRRSSVRYPTDLSELIEEMAAVYMALGRAAGAGPRVVSDAGAEKPPRGAETAKNAAPKLAYSETAGMQRALKLRLERQRDRLIRELRQMEKSTAAKSTSEKAKSPRAETARSETSQTESPRAKSNRPAESLSGGGATAARAQQLIDLITSTIAPESWEINGGRGRAMFFSPLNVLVIRNTGEAHHQIGGTLEQLRK